MAADRAPSAFVHHPDIGQKDAILNDASEIFDSPSCLDRSDHHLVERGRVADLEFYSGDVPSLDRVEPGRRVEATSVGSAWFAAKTKTASVR